MAKNFIIVEHDNDKFTFEAILRYMQMETKEIEVKSSEITDIEWLIRSAENDIDKPNGLKESFISLFADILNGSCEKIGVIWDIDNFTHNQRIKQMNNAIALAISEYATKKPEISITLEEIAAINQFSNLTVDGIEVKIACHFIHLGGKGEIEDLLKAIKNQPSLLADCVNAKLPECLTLNNEKELRDKDLVKLWVNNYVRYDTLAKKDRKDVFTKWENVMLKRSNIFDFGKDTISELKELKDFLIMLNS